MSRQSYLPNSVHSNLVSWREEHSILLTLSNPGLTWTVWTKNALCLMYMSSSSSPTAWFLWERFWNSFLREGHLEMSSNVWVLEAASALKVYSQNRYRLYFIVNIRKIERRIDKRYSPETEMKWSLPRTVWRISVALRSLGLWLRIKAAALSTYARTVIWMISFGRIIPCIWRSWIVSIKWKENWLSWDGCEATRDLMAKHLSNTSTLQWATSYSRIGQSIWMETNRKARGP